MRASARLLLLSFLTAGAAPAMLTTPQLAAERLAMATLVAEIVVDAAQSAADPRVGIRTRVSARLERVVRWAGAERAEPRGGDAIVITSPGGEVGGVGVAIDGVPRPRRGRRYRAHLKATGVASEYEVTGFDAGLVALDSLESARAFSRNRTDGSNGDGTGAYLYWPRDAYPIPYYVSLPSFLAHTDYIPAVDQAFRTWRNVADTHFDLRPMGCATVLQNDNDGLNTVILLEKDWPFDPAAIAITRNFYVAGENPRSGVILDSDILLNGQFWRFTTTGDVTKHDIQNIITHEAGHFLGLGHQIAPVDATATMLATAVPGETMKRRLSNDDIAGVRDAYPGAGNKLDVYPLVAVCPLPATGGSCLAVHGTGGAGTLPLVLFLLWLAGVVVGGRRVVRGPPRGADLL